jgi:hypothetical protein
MTLDECRNEWKSFMHEILHNIGRIYDEIPDNSYEYRCLWYLQMLEIHKMIIEHIKSDS